MVWPIVCMCVCVCVCVCVYLGLLPWKLPGLLTEGVCCRLPLLASVIIPAHCWFTAFTQLLLFLSVIYSNLISCSVFHCDSLLCYRLLFISAYCIITCFWKSVRGGWMHHLFMYVFICRSCRMAALMLCYHLIVPCTCKGDTTSTDVFRYLF